MATKVPPLKCQGIKTKLVPFIIDNLNWDGSGVWYEPFLGSGVVLFNVLPDRAIVSDRNEHIINFYKTIQSGEMTAESVREYLTSESPKLESGADEYYRAVRERFNQTHDPYDFLFLNRSCFNGVIRFNKKGEFNVPFCKKPERFGKAYVTKICNQIEYVSSAMKGRDWEFRSGDWRELLPLAGKEDCVYLDPPYIGRDTNYVGEWPESEAKELAAYAHETPARVLLSMWRENKYRKNTHIDECWNDFELREFDHYYHVGSKEKLRNAMTEALLIKPSSAVSTSPARPRRH